MFFNDISLNIDRGRVTAPTVLSENENQMSDRKLPSHQKAASVFGKAGECFPKYFNSI